MRCKAVSVALFAWLLIFVSQGAHSSIATIDFEAFAGGPVPLPPGALEDGYLLTDIGIGGVVAPPPFGAPPPVPSVGFGPGSPSAAPDLEIVQVAGGLFELMAFEFFFESGAPTPTTVTGLLGGGVVGVDVFLPTGPVVPGTPVPAMLPTTLAGVAVDKLIFDMGGAFDAPHILDNIVLNDIPAPSVLALFVLGLGLLRLRFSRRAV